MKLDTFNVTINSIVNFAHRFFFHHISNMREKGEFKQLQDTPKSL